MYNHIVQLPYGWDYGGNDGGDYVGYFGRDYGGDYVSMLAITENTLHAQTCC